jgi:hypothetical protein
MNRRAGALLVASLLLSGCGWHVTGNSGIATGKFSAAELNRFVDAAQASEAMTDPLQRCLTYPDPPGSHWSHAAVDAYCHFRTQSFISYAEIQDLIRAGHADEVDRRLAMALSQQLSQANSRGLLDHIYNNDFGGAPEVRATLDQWKRQSPRSAFAFTASAFNYIAAAGSARDAEQTPDENNPLIYHLVALARADLSAALALDPRVTPAYEGVVMASQTDHDAIYGRNAVAHGLQIDPSNYSLLAQLMESAEPGSGGSLGAMRKVAERAKAQSANNPLLLLLLPEPDVYESGICGCGYTNPAAQVVAYRVVLDQAVKTQTLSYAGNNAQSTRQPEFALVYLSEALRFDPDSADNRKTRVSVLMNLDRRPALRDSTGRFARLELDRMAAQDATRPWALAEKGQLLIDLQKWDEAWAYADGMIQAHPDDLNGWVMRALIQSGQPRAGGQDTAKYIIAHFSDRTDPQARSVVDQAHRDLALAASGSVDSVPGK